MENYMKTAQSWLSESFDPQTRAAVSEMIAGDPVALEDAFYRNLEFGTGGLRGVLGIGTNRMNKYTVGMATQGLANYIIKNAPEGENSVCISFDCRNHSDEFAKITANVLAANGLKVYLFESLRPTPELSYAIRHKGAIAGVMVTASHNPAEYNGYKVFWNDGAQITSPVDKAIVAEVNAISSPSQVKFTPGPESPAIELMGEDVDKCYLDDILSLMLDEEDRKKYARDLKIVYTPLHGTGVKLVPEALSRLGFESIYHVPEQDVNNGDFPTVKSPNPEEASALAMAIAKAEEVGADLVLATDPDADRMGIALRNDKGEIVLFNGNQTAAMLTYYVLSKWAEKGKLDPSKYCVKTIVTSELLSAICHKFGVKIYNVLTGFKYIAEIVKLNEGKGEFICGGEESYGFNVGEFVRDKDAVIACSMICECACWAAAQGKSLYQLMQDIYAEFGYYREALTSLVRKGKSGVEEIAAIMTSYRNNPPKDLAGCPVVKVVDYLDTASTGLPSSNVLQFFSAEGDVVSVRPSGTEPKIKFYFGARGNDADAKIAAFKEQFIK